MSSNKLTSLPESVFKGLKSLKYLYLSNNRIKTLPTPVFNDLQNLTALYMDSNEITSIDNMNFTLIHNVDNIQINLRCNRLSDVPQGLCGSDTTKCQICPYVDRDTCLADTSCDCTGC